MYQGTGPNAGRTFNGYNVMSIQAALSTAGIATVVDGIYGPQTRQNVMTYQSRYGLTVDGIVGPQTYGHMRSLVNAPAVYRYTWYSCSAAAAAAASAPPAGCIAMAKASGTSATPGAAQAGRFIVVQVDATNSAGTISRWTASTAGVIP
jgi:peptidoglycan hydrolase-like protein with peptidoglycan-binding domain